MAIHYDIPTLPTASGIDYSNVEEVCGYQLLLCKIFERAGGLDYPPVSNATLRKVQREGKTWLREVRFLLSCILDGKEKELAALPDLLSAYDLFYRVCNGGPCYDYLRDIKLKTVARWLKGDTSISGTDVTLFLLSETDRDIRTLDRRYSDYAFSLLGEWIDELARYGRFIDIPPKEAYQRLTYLLKDNLFAYFGRKERQEAAKAAWTKRYLLQDLSTLDTRPLLRYIGFLLTANRLGYYRGEPEDELYCRLWTEYSSRPDIHLFFRQALEIELAKYVMV